MVHVKRFQIVRRAQRRRESRKRDEWGTPNYIFDALNSHWKYTLDPCANESNRKCDYWICKESNGLIQSWSSQRVFCNPPFSQLNAWVFKALTEMKTGCELITLLLPVRSDNDWWIELFGVYEIRSIMHYDMTCKWYRDRIRFDAPPNTKVSTPRFPSVAVTMYRRSNENLQDATPSETPNSESAFRDRSIKDSWQEKIGKQDDPCSGS